MTLYERGDPNGDMLIAAWWTMLRDLGELDRTVLDSAHTLGGFYKLFDTCELIFESDEHGIWIAGWAERIMSGVMFGLWVRPDKRGKPSTVSKLLDIYDLIFSQGACVIMGITKQPKLLPAHAKLGYNLLGKVPGLWAGHDAWIVMLTPEEFYGRWRKRKGWSKPEQNSGTEQCGAVSGIDPAT